MLATPRELGLYQAVLRPLSSRIIRMQKGLVVAVVLAFAAVIAFFLFFNSGKDAPPPSPPRQQAAQPTDPAALAHGEVGRPAAASGAAIDRQEVPTGGADRADTGASGQVRGRLVDRDGRPRPGVAVELHAFALPDDFEINMPPPGLERTDEPRPHQDSDADGRFSFTVAIGKQGSIELVGDELVFGKGRTGFPRVKSDIDLGDIVVMKAAVVAGTVHDNRGQPVADVKVSALLGEFGIGSTSDAITDRDGHFQLGKLRQGPVTLRTASAQFLPTTAKFELQAEEKKLDVVLEVAAGKAVSGQVVDDVGRPVANIKVGAKRTEERPGLQMERFTPDEATTTDVGGWFLLSGLSGDSAAIRAYGDGYTTASEDNVPVGTGNLVLRVQRLASIAGTLRDTTGKPIAGSRVRATAGGDGMLGGMDLGFGMGRSSATTDANGAFQIDNVPPGTITVAAEGKAHRPVQVAGLQLAPAQTMKGVQLIADLGATARVKVTDDVGQPVAGARVRAEQADQGGPPQGPGGMFRSRRVAVSDDNGGGVHVLDGSERLGEATTGDDGIAELGGLPACTARLTATHAELAEAAPVTLIVPAAGTVEASMSLRRPGWASMRVTGVDGPVAGARFVVHGPIGAGEDERDRAGSVDASGESRFGPLPAGDYFAELEMEAKARSLGGATIVFGGDTHRLQQTRVKFTLAAGEELPVELQKPVLTRLYGTVTGADGPTAGVVVELERRGEDTGIGGAMGGMGGASARSDEQGQYELTDVEPGEYDLLFGKPEQLVKARQLVTVVANEAERRADLALRFGKLRIQAVSDNAPGGIAGAEVELVPVRPGEAGKPRQPQRMMMVSMTVSSDGAGPQSTTMTMGQNRKKTGPDGSVEIDDVPPGAYTVKITDDAHSDFELPSQQVVEGQLTDCGRVHLQPAGHIRGTVLGADGQTAGMAMVHCRRVGEDNQEPKREPAMAGQIKFDGLAPGRYALKARSLMGDEQAFGPEVEVDVEAGKAPATVELTLPKS